MTGQFMSSLIIFIRIKVSNTAYIWVLDICLASLCKEHRKALWDSRDEGTEGPFPAESGVS